MHCANLIINASIDYGPSFLLANPGDCLEIAVVYTTFPVCAFDLRIDWMTPSNTLMQKILYFGSNTPTDKIADEIIAQLPQLFTQVATASTAATPAVDYSQQLLSVARIAFRYTSPVFGPNTIRDFCRSNSIAYIANNLRTNMAPLSPLEVASTPGGFWRMLPLFGQTLEETIYQECGKYFSPNTASAITGNNIPPGIHGLSVSPQTSPPGLQSGYAMLQQQYNKISSEQLALRNYDQSSIDSLSRHGSCKHEYVNQGFMHIRMACKHCGRDQ